MANATDFTADGPTEVGFRTGGDGTGITNGVVAQGKKTGVHGIGRTVPATDFGETIGVFGEGRTGVQGIGIQSDLSVLGISIGVFGQGFDGVRGRGDGGVGVAGESKTIGVQGVGETVGVRGEGDVTGVIGDTEKGVGVDGHSRDGSGIRGSSDTAYGGVFRSTFAQIRLEPAILPIGPPRTGSHEKGEFFVDARGALFYCVGGSPARWQQLAGPSVLRDLISDFTTAVRNLIGRNPSPPGP